MSEGTPKIGDLPAINITGGNVHFQDGIFRIDFFDGPDTSRVARTAIAVSYPAMERLLFAFNAVMEKINGQEKSKPN